MRGNTDFQRINPDRLGDVLEFGRAEIVHGKVEPRLHLAIGILREADRARFGDALQSRGDVDAIAHQVAVALLDNVAQMDADAKLDAALGRQAGVALNHAVLHFDAAAHGIDDAAKFDQSAIAGALHHAPVMHGHGRIDQVAPERPQPRQSAIFIGAGEPAIANHICCEYCREFPVLGHDCPPVTSEISTKAGVKTGPFD